jgi:hypothetical protein
VAEGHEFLRADGLALLKPPNDGTAESVAVEITVELAKVVVPDGLVQIGAQDRFQRFVEGFGEAFCPSMAKALLGFKSTGSG